MFSRTRLQLLAIALTLAGSGLAGCGHKAPPIPPPLDNPARTADLAVQQRDQSALLTFSYPQTTVSGTLLPKLERIEVWGSKRAVAELLGGDDDPDDEASSEDDEASTPADADEVGAMAEESDAESEGGGEDDEGDEGDEGDDGDDAPEPPLETLLAMQALEFEATAGLFESFDTVAIDQATEGDKITLRVELGEAEHEQWVHTFAIKTFAPNEAGSVFSNLRNLVQRVPPAPPTDFQTTAEAGGVRLSWASTAAEPDEPDEPDTETDTEADLETLGFRVFRRPAQSRLYGQPLSRQPAEATEYLDTSANYGERYIYAVTAIGHDNPIVESFFGGEREIDYADLFAPSPPTDLIALADPGRVRLLWDASSEDDVAGYVIFRRQAGQDFRRLTDKAILGVEYSDRAVTSGTTYDYRVSAVDGVGNQSEPSASVVVLVP